MHQSVWLLAQNPATHPHTITHTQTCQGGKEAAKKGKREVSRKGKKGRREKKGGREEAIWSSAFTLTLASH